MTEKKQQHRNDTVHKEQQFQIKKSIFYYCL
jgi:uncharacterized membrane protein